MNDDAQIKVMQSLGLDYNPAINSILQFQKYIDSSSKQLAQMKMNAIQGSRDVNNIFSSQLGNANNRAILDQWGIPIRTIREEAQALVQPISEMNNALNNTGNTVENTGNRFTSNAAKFYAFVKVGKEITSTIKDVEMGMVEIARVMDDTSFIFDEYRDNLFKLGVEYGQTFDNVQSIALRWSQSGYNVADSLELTRTSLLALNTAELDAKNATESMIGIMAQWQLQADDLALVMDKVNITADNYSVTSQDLVDGLLRSSGAAKVMGMSLDDTIATLTVLRETTGRTGAEVGNALSSILSYIQRPKSIDVMESLGIRMFADEAKTEFRNVMEVFEELSNKWKDPSMSEGAKDALMAGAQEAGLFAEELANIVGVQEEFAEMTQKATEAQGEFTDIEKRDAAQAAAGVYRRNYFIGLLERFSDTQKVLNGLMDAEGYSMGENAKTMDTLEKKQESLKTSAEALAVAIGDAGLSDALKALADGGTNAITAINEMPKPMKDLVLATISTYTAIKALQFGMKIFGIEIPNISTLITTLKLKVFELGNALNGGAVGMLAFAKANPILALSAAVGVIVAITNAIKKQREEQEELIEAFNSQRDISQELNGLLQSYKDLGEQSSLTAEQQTELLNIKQKIKDLLPESKNALDNENLSLSEQISIVESLNEAELERLRIQAQKQLNRGENAYEKDKQDLKAATEMLEILNKQWAEYSKKQVDGTATKAELNALKSVTAEIEREIEKRDKATTSIEAYESALEIVKNIINGNKDAVNNHAEAIGSLNDDYNITQEILDSLTKSFDDITDRIQAYQTILAELNSKEGLSVKTKRDIITNHQELLPYLSDEQELRKQLIKIIEIEEKTQREAYANMIASSESFYTAKIKGNAELVKSLNEYYGVDFNNYKTLAEAKGKVEAELISQLSGMWAKYYKAISQGNTNAEAEMEQKVLRGGPGAKEASQVLSTLHKVQDMSNAFEKISLDLSGIDFKGINTSGIKGPKKGSASKDKGEKSQLLEFIDAEIRAIKIKNDNLEKTSDLLNQQLSIAKSIEGIEGLNEQHRVTGKIIENNKNLIKSYKYEQDDFHKKANDLREANKKYNIDSWFDANAEQTVDYVNQYNKATKKQQEEMDKVFQQMQKIKKSWMESDKEARNLVNTTTDLEKELSNIVIKQKEMTTNKLREIIEAEKRNAYMDLEYRQRIANEQLKLAREQMESDVRYYESRINGIQDEIDRIQDDERLRQESTERSKRLDEISQLEDRYYALQNKNISDLTEEQAELLGLERERETYIKRQEDMEKERIKRQEYENELLELRNKLDNVRNQRNIRQYKELEDGTWSFEFVADQDAIDNVEKQIKDTEGKIEDSKTRIEELEKQHSKELKDLQKQTLKDLQKAREDYDEWEYQNDLRREIEAKQRRIKEYQDEIKDLQDKFAEKERLTNEAFATEKENLDRFYTDIDMLTDEKMLELYDTFDGNWLKISEMMKGYFDDIKSEYMALVEQLSKPLPSPRYSGGGGGNNDKPERTKFDTSGSTVMIMPNGRTSSVSNNYVDEYKKKGYTVKHKGGVVGDGSRDLPQIANQLFNTKPNEQMIKALKGELFVPEENLSKYFLPNMQGILKDMVSSTAKNNGLYIRDLLKQAKNTQNLVANINIPNLSKSTVSHDETGYSQKTQPTKVIHNHIGKLVFPKVKDAKEIEESIMGLERISLQYD